MALTPEQQASNRAKAKQGLREQTQTQEDKAEREMLKTLGQALQGTTEHKAQRKERWKALMKQQAEQHGQTWDTPAVIFLEWSALPPALRDPRTQEELATELGISPEKLGSYKHKPGWQEALWTMQLTLVQENWLMDELTVLHTM